MGYEIVKNGSSVRYINLEDDFHFSVLNQMENYKSERKATFEISCGAQYVGYSMRQLRERFIEHRTTYESPVGRHCLARDHFNKLKIQVLTQAPASETNPELWLKQQEYYYPMREARGYCNRSETGCLLVPA